MPLSKQAQAYIAFMCDKGIFQWTRVPMGLKNAAAYFQRVVTDEVLSGLVNRICEIYIDDCIIHAKTEEEFLVRLRQILERCKKFNITINPEKCEFGMSEIEILGHTINSEGSTFSPKKLEEVFEMPLPKTGTQLLSFLGLVNYFSDHIQGYAKIMAPLRSLASRFPGSKIINEWGTENTEAFNKAKQAVLELQTLYFIDYNAEVYLHTDASKSGIGSYLFQVIDGKERAIAFMSKALKGAELNWSTFETQGYAI